VLLDCQSLCAFFIEDEAMLLMDLGTQIVDSGLDSGRTYCRRLRPGCWLQSHGYCTDLMSRPLLSCLLLQVGSGKGSGHALASGPELGPEH
jgi:hypothetical protein